jgi:tetratricopeptide (TPR) repeat protein
MERKRRVTMLLFLAGCAAIGCSRSGASSQTAPPQESAQVKPVAAASQSVPLPPMDDEGFTASERSTPAGPVSLADGETAYRARKYSDATALFEHYTAQHPKNAWGHFMLGLSAWKANDLAKAEKAFDAALAIDPLHVKSLVNLSRVLIDQKRFDEALDRLSHASGIEPTSNEVHRLLGRTLNAQGKTDAAVEAYRRAIELNERDVWSMNNLGLLFLEQKRADEALPLLAKAVELRKDVPAFHNNLGMALEHAGRLKDAAAAYSDALTTDPQYDRAKQNLARVEAVKGTDEH